MLVAESSHYSGYNYSSYGYTGGDYGFIKIRVGKFFKKPLKSISKMAGELTRRPLKAIKKYPILGVGLAAGGIAAAKAAGLTSYLAPLKAKAVTAKWALKAKLAPVNARAGAFVRHRVIGIGAQRVSKKLVKKPMKAAVVKKPGKSVVKKGILSSIWETVGEPLKPAVQTAIQASLAKKLGLTPYTRVNTYGTPTVPTPTTPTLPTMRMPTEAVAPQPTARAGMLGLPIPKQYLPLLLIGGIGLLSLLLIMSRRDGVAPMYMPPPMPYPYPAGR